MNVKEIYKWKPWSIVVLESERPVQILLIISVLCGFWFFCICLSHSEPQFSYLQNGGNDTSLREVFKDKRDHICKGSHCYFSAEDCEIQQS